MKEYKCITTSKNQENCVDENSSNIINKTESYFAKNMKLLAESYDYIILTTRRCFCVYTAMINDGIFQDFSNVYSSQKVDIIGNDFNDANVLLMDDIMIHGTAVYTIYKKINEEYHAKNIDTIVFTRNIEYPDYYRFKTKKYTALTKEVASSWRYLSNQFINYIHDKNQPYISYIYGYSTKTDIVSEAINETNCCKLFEISKVLSDSMSFKSYDINKLPKIYISSFKNDYSFVQKASLRIIESHDSNIDFKQVLPYVQLKNFNSENLIEIWESIWKDEIIPIELKSIKNPKDIFKSIVAITSLFMFAEIFYPNKKIDELSLLPTKFIDKSFTDDFIVCVQKNIKNDALNIISKKYKDSLNVEIKYNDNSNDSLKELQILKEGFNNLINENDKINTGREIANLIEKCIYNISQIEEKDFKRSIKSHSNNNGELINLDISIESRKSINLDFLYRFLELNSEIENVAYAIMLFFLESGMISHTVKCVNGIVGTFIQTGEQSYHIFADLLGVALRPIYQVLSYVTRLDDIRKEKFLKDFIVKLDELPSDCSILKYKENIVSLLNNPPVDFRSDYFGVIKMFNNTKNEQNIVEENKIMSELNLLLSNIMC